MDEKQDLRILKSKKAIKEAFIELIKEKGYANITVTDISKKAMINRKTFYTHYETKEMLYESIVKEMLTILSPVLEDMPRLKGKELRRYIAETLMRFKEHKDIFNALLNDRTNSDFLNRLTENLKYNLINKAHLDDKIKGTSMSAELLTNAYLAIFITFSKWWINNSSISPDELIDMVLDFFSPKTLEIIGVTFDE